MFAHTQKLDFYIVYNKFGFIQVFNQCHDLIKEIEFEKEVHALALNDDLHVVVANLTTVYVFTLPDFKMILALTQTKNQISSIDIGGDFLVVGSKCGNVYLNNMSKNETKHVIQVESQIAQTKMIDTMNLFSFLTFQGKIYFYNISNLSLQQTFEIYTNNFCIDLMNYMCVSRDCELLVLYSLNQVHFFNKSLGKSVANLEIFKKSDTIYLTSVHICKGCQYVATSSNDGFVFVHNFIKGNLIFKFFIYDIDNFLFLDNQIVFHTRTNQGVQRIEIFLADPFSEEKCECLSNYLIKNEVKSRNMLEDYKHCVINKFEFNKNFK